jgi:NarL family two-component system response regulator LiaR
MSRAAAHGPGVPPTGLTGERSRPERPLSGEARRKASSHAAPTRVVIADDHPLMRAGLRERLARSDTGIEVVGEASDGQEAYELAGRLHPDVVLLDIAMPGLNGIDATRKIKAAWPEIGILILTAYDDEQYVYALIDAGAAGYLLKTTDGSALADAVHRIRQGEAVLSPAITEKVVNRIARGARAPSQPASNPLSEREREVLALAAQGASNKTIACELHVSVRTIHAHMRNIFGKLEVASRTEAVMLAAHQGWLETGDGARTSDPNA